jgi:hypothetical protein
LTFYVGCLQGLDARQGGVVRKNLLHFCQNLSMHVIARRLDHTGDSVSPVDAEGKLMLLWLKAVDVFYALASESGASCGADLVQLAETIHSWGSHKMPNADGASTIGGLLSSIGISYFSGDSVFSPSFRVAARMLSVFLLCQVTPNGRDVRLSADAAPGPPHARKYQNMVANARSLDHWQKNDSKCVAGRLPEVIKTAGTFSQDRRNTLAHTERLVGSICHDLFPTLLAFVSLV